MGFRFQRRIRLGRGLGFNISKSGITPSFRSRRGSISSKGFSLRTGVPGLQFRKSFSKKGGCLVMVLMMFILTIVVACTESGDDCPSKTCSDFQTQSEAQSEFDSNPSCYANLDSDDDNIACENLPN